jgi:hypothetical protein
MAAAIVDVFRGTQKGDGTYQDDPVPGYEGMVELDAVYSAQATSAPDLAVRWHGTAGTCCAAVCPEDIHSPDNAILPVIRAETTSWYHADIGNATTSRPVRITTSGEACSQQAEARIEAVILEAHERLHLRQWEADLMAAVFAKLQPAMTC